MVTIDKSTNEYFLTLAKFEELKNASQLEVGAVYHIIDDNTQPQIIFNFLEVNE